VEDRSADAIFKKKGEREAFANEKGSQRKEGKSQNDARGENMGASWEGEKSISEEERGTKTRISP
jgi:hypothetical protein